ncbi:hypothetical protein SLEP1_g7906 [Rubroshorea leprosula]|uniref:Uncharacterized protein n=1 Tax=Rubroshorea leprosula TaxID=152421 RepID=A0AAV5I652_9ROSI|nr:hypothetical protein SLEP1_g7906 [Rubroshorea leprosula]
MHASTSRARCTTTPAASNSSLESAITCQTDKLGTYVLTIDGEQEDEVCEIALVESSNSVCSEINKDAFLRRSAGISLTTNNGIISPVRAANPLGFMRKTPLPLCTDMKSSENSV